jgi:hypothetical protein
LIDALYYLTKRVKYVNYSPLVEGGMRGGLVGGGGEAGLPSLIFCPA